MCHYIRWIGILPLCFITGTASAAVSSQKDLEGVLSPTDGFIRPVQFIVSVYRGTDTKNTQSMRVADGQAAFIGSSKQIPIPAAVVTGTSKTKIVTTNVEYKTLESGVELSPHLIGRFVQLEMVEKEQRWNKETKQVETFSSHSVITIPLDEWAKVRGAINDNEDIEDIYNPHRPKSEEVWVKVQLAES